MLEIQHASYRTKRTIISMKSFFIMVLRNKTVGMLIYGPISIAKAKIHVRSCIAVAAAKVLIKIPVIQRMNVFFKVSTG